MTQTEYARRLDVSDAFVSKLVSGEKTLSLVKAKISADIFNCRIEDLYEWEYIPTKRKRP